jgi:hypothetical protein
MGKKRPRETVRMDRVLPCSIITERSWNIVSLFYEPISLIALERPGFLGTE